MKSFRQVIFVYHNKEREYVINEMMKDCFLRTCTAEEILLLHCDELFLNAYNYYPDLIIIFLPRDDYVAQVLTMLKLVYHCIIISIPTEQFLPLDEETLHRLVGYNEQPQNLIDYYFFWGSGIAKETTKILLQYKKVISEDQVKIFGYLPYERNLVKQYRKKTETVSLIEEKQKQFRKTILFVTAYMAKDYTLEDLIGESYFSENSDEELEEGKRFIISRKRYNDYYIGAIDKLAEGNKDCLFLVKTHPVENCTINNNQEHTRYDILKNRDNIILITESNQISSYLVNVDLFFHYGSTTAQEVYLYNIPIILLQNDCPFKSSDTYGLHDRGATIKIDVSDLETMQKVVSTIPSTTRVETIEKTLYDIMNYKYGEDYHPSTILSELFRNTKDYHKLLYKDSIVKKNANGIYAKNRRHTFIKMIPKKIFKGQFSESFKIMKWVTKYYFSCIMG